MFTVHLSIISIKLKVMLLLLLLFGFTVSSTEGLTATCAAAFELSYSGTDPGGEDGVASHPPCLVMKPHTLKKQMGTIDLTWLICPGLMDVKKTVK